MDKQQNNKLMDMLPVLTFIISFFIFELFDWMAATKFILAVLISVVTFFIMVSDFKEEYKNPEQLKKLNYFVGLLTFLFVLIFLNGFLHWNRMIPIYQRMGILLGLVLIYFIILFRAVRLLANYKSKAEVKPHN